MFYSYYSNVLKLSQLAFEVQHVIVLRLLRLTAGGALAEAEWRRMMWEKAFVAAQIGVATTTAVATGRTGSALTSDVIARYRRRVRANRRRLGRIGS